MGRSGCACRTLPVEGSVLDVVSARRLACEMEADPTACDLVLDLRSVRSIEDEAALVLRDAVFWRIHWSRVGCVVGDDSIREVLEAQHLGAVAAIGRDLDGVVRAMDDDDRPLPLGRRLIMGPGPAAG